MPTSESNESTFGRICSALIAAGPVPYYALGLAALVGYHNNLFVGVAYLALAISHQLAYRRDGG